MQELVILAVRPFLKMFTPSCSQRIRKVSGIVLCCTCVVIYEGQFSEMIYLNPGPNEVKGVGDEGRCATRKDRSTTLHCSVWQRAVQGSEGLLVGAVEAPPTGRAGHVVAQGCQVAPVEAPWPVPLVDRPDYCPGNLCLCLPCHIDGKGTCYQEGRLVGSVCSQPEHHHMLRDDVEGNNDGLADHGSSTAAAKRLHLCVFNSTPLQAVTHQLICRHIAHPRHHLPDK